MEALSLLLDLKKLFDCVGHSAMRETLDDAGFPTYLWRSRAALYSGSRCIEWGRCILIPTSLQVRRANGAREAADHDEDSCTTALMPKSPHFSAKRAQLRPKLSREVHRSVPAARCT
eukprot:4910815-Amphidinium_carterae.1